MNKKIVLVNQTTGFLTIDIVNAYAEKYDDVALIVGELFDSERPLNNKVRLIHIVKYNRASGLKRIITWGLASVQLFFILLFRFRGWHVVFVTNPPMSYITARCLSNSYSIVIYDLYPDALRNVGIKEDGLIYKWWAMQNKKLFLRASHVYTLSESMAEAISAYMEKKKITVIPNWSGSDKFKPIDKHSNPFAKEYNLQEKFVVMYSGNMGYTHSVDVLVDVASKMKEDHHVHFLLIGNGKKKNELEERIKKEQLDNCTMLDYQPENVLPYSLATADIGVITLNADSAKVSVPSKTYNLLAVGAPLLCLSPAECEMVRLINQFDNGECFRLDDIDSVICFIKRMASDQELHNKYSMNSLNASKDFTWKNAQLYVE